MAVSTYPASFNLTNLNGINGFVINGIKAGDRSGFSVSSAGDMNADGIADVVIMAPFADPNGQSNAGQSYVVFGRQGVRPAALNLSSLNGSNGFVLNGVYTSSGYTYDTSVASVGDVNNDGLDDVIINAQQASPNGQNGAGQSYIVFGRQAQWPAILNLSSLNGNNGFALNGINKGDRAGISVASAGDVNGDGISDVIIGAPSADPNGLTGAGQSYVVFGRSGVWPAAMNLSSVNGSNGFVLNGIQTNDGSGFSVASAGDINGDGLSDMIIGAQGAGPNGQSGAGQSYVIFGRPGPLPSVMNLSSLNGSNGFILNGINQGDSSGHAVASAGDVNKDEIADIIIGAVGAASNEQSSLTGQSYVVFGQRTAWPAVLNLSSLNGSNGFILNGINNGDYSGGSIASVGDINGDRISDFIIGAFFADQSYVVFGRQGMWPAVVNLSSLNGSTGFVLRGIKPGDNSGISVASARDINGDGVNDVIIGAPGANNGAGQSCIVFGDQSISLISNQLTVTQGQSVILNNTYLSANSGNFNSSLIQYSVSNIQYGQFELLNNPGVVISNFTQMQMNAGLVRFVHDGSSNAPNYSVVAQTGIGFAIPPAPQAANISFSLLPTPPNITTVFNATSSLANRNGLNGFILAGNHTNDLTGYSVAPVGDINGDGLNDVIIGAPGATSNNQIRAGQTYVVFGARNIWPKVMNLSSLNGSNGFVLNGFLTGNGGIFGLGLGFGSGCSVASAGDVNGDGVADLIIGASVSPNGQSNAGQSYVIFGSKKIWPAVISLSVLNGSNGFVLNGIHANDNSGISVASAGDVNGDAINDLIIGAYSASPNGQLNAGQSYVVFGSRKTWPAVMNLSLLNGSNGFTLNGVNANDFSASSVASAGDVNGDGLNDIIIGATPNNQIHTVQSYIVFGSRKNWPATINLSSLNGTNGFTLNGAYTGICFSSVASAGDINGDGLNDVIIGFYVNIMSGQRQSYVVFGSKNPWPAVMNLSSLNGSNGFTVGGMIGNYISSIVPQTPISVFSAQDINHDGVDDVIIGAEGLNVNNQYQAGQNFVVFGSKNPWPAVISVSSLNGANGFALTGNAYDISGSSVASAGDINGDGLNDLIIGACGASPNNQTNAGQSYVVFGDMAIPFINNQLTITAGQSAILDLNSLSVFTGNYTGEVYFTLSNIQNGKFELTTSPGIAISNFTKTQLNARLVCFVQDGSINVPSYSVVAQTGIGLAIPPAPQAANIIFSLAPSTSTSMQSSVVTSTASNTPTISSSTSTSSSMIVLTSSSNSNPSTSTPTISFSSSSSTSSSSMPSSSSSSVSASSSTILLTSSISNFPTDTPTISFSSTSSAPPGSSTPSSSSSSVSASSGALSLTSSSSSNPPTDTPTISLSSTSSTPISSASASISLSSFSSSSSTSATLSALSPSSAATSSSLASSSMQSTPTSSITSSQRLASTTTSPALFESSQGSSGISTTIIVAAAAGAGGLALAAGTLFFLHRRRKQRMVLAQETKLPENIIQNKIYLPDSSLSDNHTLSETDVDRVHYETVDPLEGSQYEKIPAVTTAWSPQLYAVGSVNKNKDQSVPWNENVYRIK